LSCAGSRILVETEIKARPASIGNRNPKVDWKCT
jgi:hypothetical protein